MAKKVVLKHTDKTRIQIVVVAWITFCTLFCLLPLFVTILNALKSSDEVARNIFAFPQFNMIISNVAYNFSTSWNAIYRAFGNSLLLALIGAFVDCVLGAILGYIFTYKRFPFKEIIFMMFISVMLLPSIMGMPILVPFMRTVLHLNDTYIGYLLPNFAGGQIGGLFLFRTFFAQQPRSIYESAQIEGANDVQIFCKLTVPLAFPIILYKFVGTFSGLYNDYLWPSLILSEKMTLMPIMLSVQERFMGSATGGGASRGAVYAMYLISSVPLICTSIISMKFFSSGDFAAGIKL